MSVGRRLLPAALLAVAGFMILPAAASATQTHVVQLGETLWSIAAGHGVSVDALAAANGLASPHVLRFRQKLVIPAKIVPPLSSIASRHGTTIEALVSANSLTDPNTLRFGQRLRIPTASVARTPGPVLPLSRTIAQTAVPSRGAKWGSALISNVVRVDVVRWDTDPAGSAESRRHRVLPHHAAGAAGIYVGNNLFVHAASAFGRGRVTSMDYRYTTRSATWARADFRQSQFLLGLYLACRVRWWL